MYRIEISNNRTLQEIQDEFNEYFPHLKIQFYQIDKFYPGCFSELLVESSDEKLSSFRLKNNSGYLYINEDLTGMMLKQNILDYFGLKAEIFQVTDLNYWSQNSISDSQLLREIDFEIT